tara:strand:- start:3207 stop:3959 length:753 start_codon:yes stop_codon:yes gene_type:complete
MSIFNTHLFFGFITLFLLRDVLAQTTISSPISLTRQVHQELYLFPEPIDISLPQPNDDLLQCFANEWNNPASDPFVPPPLVRQYGEIDNIDDGITSNDLWTSSFPDHQGLMDIVPWTEISMMNIIGDINELCTRSKCYSKIITTSTTSVSTTLLSGSNLIKHLPAGITIAIGIVDGYTKTKETGSVGAGISSGMIKAGAGYYVSAYLIPGCFAAPDPTFLTKPLCLYMGYLVSRAGNTIGDDIANSIAGK